MNDRSLVDRLRAEEVTIGGRLIAKNPVCQEAADRIAQLEAQLSKPEPIAWHTEDHLTDKSATTYDREVAERWRAKGWPVRELFAAPVADNPADNRIAELERQNAELVKALEPIAWIPEDELPESLPGYAYDVLHAHSRVDGIRLFPIFGPKDAA